MRMDSDRREAALADILSQVQRVIIAGGAESEAMRGLAAETAGAIEALSPTIELHTSAVCPDCAQVCCVNRHSYHELGDIVFLCSLGKRPPIYRQDVDDAGPCQFLGERGCRLKRSLRPHRCNWFFCSPLLERIRSSAAREYRAFMTGLREIRLKRERLIAEFGETAREGRCDPARLKRISDEIFFRDEIFVRKFDIL